MTSKLLRGFLVNKPNPFVEVFMSLVKWFLVIILINNLIWAGVLYVILHESEVTNSITQDGYQSFQEVTNG